MYEVHTTKKTAKTRKRDKKGWARFSADMSKTCL